MKNFFSRAIGIGSLATALILIGAFFAYPAAIQQLVGLAVAQSSTKWNLLADMAKGDANQNGVMLQSPCLWNGTT